MANTEPHIEVYDVERIVQTPYGSAGKVALIGAFPTSTIGVEIYTSLDEAKAQLKGEYILPTETGSGTVVPSSYISFYCLDYIFNATNQSRGAESVLIVNTNSGKETLSPNIAKTDLDNAYVLLKEEDFDILTIADNTPITATVSSSTVLNPVWSALKTFLDEMYLAQKPFGIITGIDMTSATTTIVGEFKALFHDRGIFKAVATPVKITGQPSALNLAQSGCWHSSFTAGRPVNKSETAKVYNGISGNNTKEDFPLSATITWKKLLDCGFHTTKYKNRRLGTIQCLSNITPADYDMKIERVKNYFIKRLTLADVLGDDNNRVTYDYLKGLLEYERQLAMNNNYLVDMEYSLASVTTDKVKVNAKLYIADIIRVIELDVALEITAYEGA